MRSGPSSRTFSSSQIFAQYDHEANWRYPGLLTRWSPGRRLHGDGVRSIIVAGQVPTWAPVLPILVGRDVLERGAAADLHAVAFYQRKHLPVHCGDDCRQQISQIGEHLDQKRRAIGRENQEMTLNRFTCRDGIRILQGVPSSPTQAKPDCPPCYHQRLQRLGTPSQSADSF